MAKRQITIDDGSKGRKQVDFDVQPLNLNPTITNGGRWDVQVAPTPKTTQAQQLSESLKTLPRVAQQFSKLQKGLGTDRAGAISGVDAEEELQRLKKEEPDTFTNFMRNEAYRDSLMEKHVRTQMVPKTLVSMKKAANARVYKTEEEFNANLDEQVSTSWTEFETSVGKDIANSSKGRTIWNNLTDNIRGEAQVAYYASKDAVALENDLDSIEHRVLSKMSATDLDGNRRDVTFDFVPEFTKTEVKNLMQRHDISRGQAMAHMRGVMATKLETLNIQGKHLQALDLAEELSRTTGTDGVRLYEDDSKTSLQIARATKVARKGIEDLEDDLNDIEQRDLDIFTGSVSSSFGFFSMGKRFSNLTPTRQEQILKTVQLLDPTYTVDKLNEVMGVKGDGDIGGGLEEFQGILEDISVNGSDYGVEVLNRTSTAVARARTVAQNITAPPKAERNKDKRDAYQEQYRRQRMDDPDYTLVDFLGDNSITVWPEIKALDEALVTVTDMMKTPTYKGVGKTVKETIDTVYGQLEKKELLGAVSTRSLPILITGFTESIQKTLTDEIESGELELDGVEARSKELIDSVTTSMDMILSNKGGGDIMLQDANKPSATGKEELLHDTVLNEEGSRPVSYGRVGIGPDFWDKRKAGDSREVEAPFKTNESQLQTLTKNRDGKAFGIVQLTESYNKRWSQEDIDGDRAEMVKRMGASSTKGEYREALKFNLYTYGLDLAGDPTEAMLMLDKSGMDARDVSLFAEQAQVRLYTENIYEVYKKIIDADTLTPQDIKTAEQGRTLGLFVDGELNEQKLADRLNAFLSVQLELQKQNGR